MPRSLSLPLRRLLPSAVALASLGLMAGCPATTTKPRTLLSTRAYMLDVRENAGAPEVRLIALELAGEGTDEFLAETVAIPAEAAAMDDPADAAAPRRDVYRVGVRDEELRIAPIVDRDILLVVAEPREEILADLKLLSRLRETKAQRTADADATASEDGFGPIPLSEKALAALGELTAESNLARASEAALAESAAAADLTPSTEEQLAQLDEKIAAVEADLASHLERFAELEDDVDATREVRHAIAAAELKLSGLNAKRKKTAGAGDSAPDGAGEGAWTDDELDELRLQVAAVLGAIK